MIPGIFGSIIGLLGTAISRWTDIAEKKAETKYQLELAKSNERVTQLELDKEKLRAQTQTAVAQLEAKARADEANAKAESAIMTASYRHDEDLAGADGSKFGTLVRGILRPFLTVIYTVTFLFVVWYATTPEIINSQAVAIFGAFIETAVAITLWWFGLRRGSK